MRTLEDHICVFCFIGKNLLQAEHPALHDSFAGKNFQRIGFVCCMKFTGNLLRFFWFFFGGHGIIRGIEDHAAVWEQKRLSASWKKNDEKKEGYSHGEKRTETPSGGYEEYRN